MQTKWKSKRNTHNFKAYVERTLKMLPQRRTYNQSDHGLIDLKAELYHTIWQHKPFDRFIHYCPIAENLQYLLALSLPFLESLLLAGLVVMELPRPWGASLRPKLLAAWPRCRLRMWKMCFRLEGYVVYALRKDCSATEPKRCIKVTAHSGLFQALSLAIKDFKCFFNVNNILYFN